MQASSQEAKDDRLTGAADFRVIVNETLRIKCCFTSQPILSMVRKKINFKVCLYFKVIPVGS